MKSIYKAIVGLAALKYLTKPVKKPPKTWGDWLVVGIVACVLWSMAAGVVSFIAAHWWAIAGVALIVVGVILLLELLR